MCLRSRTSLSSLSLLDQPGLGWSYMASPTWNSLMDVNKSIMCDSVSHITGDKLLLSAHFGAWHWDMIMPLAIFCLLLVHTVVRTYSMFRLSNPPLYLLTLSHRFGPAWLTTVLVVTYLLVHAFCNIPLVLLCSLRGSCRRSRPNMYTSCVFCFRATCFLSYGVYDPSG